MYFQYCPKCKAKLSKNQKRLLTCAKCDFLFYINVAPATALILENNKGEVVLAKRKFPPKMDYWDVPGGFIEFNESIEDGAFREAKEELGVALNQLKYFGSYYGPYYYHGFIYQTLIIVLIGKIGRQTLRPGDDVKAVRFFPLNKLPYDKIAFDGVKRALHDYQKLKR